MICNMIFKIITEELQKELKSNMPQIRILLKKNPAMAYTRITEIGKEVGKKFNIELLVNFPHRGKIENFEIEETGLLSQILEYQSERHTHIDTSTNDGDIL